MRSENINIKISRISRDNQKVEQIKRSKTSQYKKSRLFEEWGGGMITKIWREKNEKFDINLVNFSPKNYIFSPTQRT